MDEQRDPRSDDAVELDDAYEPPALTHLGSLAELTQKTVGFADGSTFLGLDIGS